MVDVGLGVGRVWAQPGCLKGAYENLSGLRCPPFRCSILRLCPLLQMRLVNQLPSERLQTACNQEQL